MVAVVTGVDTDLATLREHIIGTGQYAPWNEPFECLDRVEAELSRLRGDYLDYLHEATDAKERAEAAEAWCVRLQQALALGDKWLDVNYGYLNPERDPLLVEFAVATREALAGPEQA
jgi:hypothetical protein